MAPSSKRKTKENKKEESNVFEWEKQEKEDGGGHGFSMLGVLQIAHSKKEKLNSLKRGIGD